MTFNFFETGNTFIKDGKIYKFSRKKIQSEMAKRSGLRFNGIQKPIILRKPASQISIFDDEIIDKCGTCRKKKTCSGCNECGMCMF